MAPTLLHRTLFAYLILLVVVDQLQHPFSAMTSTLKCVDGICSPKSPSDQIIDAAMEVRVLLDAYIDGNNNKKSSQNEWLKQATSFDIQRFLNLHNGNIKKSYNNLISHSQWRTEPHAANEIMTRAEQFEKSNLNREIFWLGESKQGCPTLVVRSNYHDGADYDEDPVKFTDFVIYQLEKGRKLYGLGANKRACLIIDRVPKDDSINKSSDNFDFKFVPNLVNLFRHVYSVLIVNYPDILETALIVPSTWFSATCFGIIGKVLDKKVRDSFQLIKEDEVVNKMNSMFYKEQLPAHLGGSSYGDYGGSCTRCLSSTEQQQQQQQLQQNRQHGLHRNIFQKFSHISTTHEMYLSMDL